MVLKKTVVNSRVAYVDNDNRLMFTKGELEIARKRYEKALAKKKGE